MLRIGITGANFIEWGGGLDFLRTVASSLYATSVPIELHFLAPGTGPRASLYDVTRLLRAAVAKNILGRKVATSHAPSRADLHRAIQSFDVPIEFHNIDIGMNALAGRAKHLSLDVLLPSFVPLPFGRDLPWLGYIYDFQHRYLPQFFTEKERKQRDCAFQSMLSRAPGVIVNAQMVASNIKEFFPNTQAAVFTLPFSAAPSHKWFDLDDAPVREKYNITNRYFIICNQFWQHKDHSTAFDAFDEFIRRYGYADIDLVCTGATGDFRSVDYFKSLIEKLREKGIEKRVHILGMIPKNEQIALMKGAIGLIQPTLFEGGPGGGAAYDAVSLGVPAIISDIPVNLEIIGEELVSFFRSRDPMSLVGEMQNCFKYSTQNKPGFDRLIEKGRVRRTRCGNVLLEAIDFVRR